MTRPSSLPLRWGLLADERPRPPDLVSGLIPRGRVVLVVGQKGARKSFVMLDMALCVSTGRPWLNRDVEKTRVLYVAAEAEEDLVNRSAAWRAHHDVAAHPDVASLGPIRLVRDAATIASVVAVEKIGLVIIDTLNAAARGDEQSADWGGSVIDACRTITATGATVMLVHHTGKDKATGSRGTSALPDGADVELTLIALDDTTRISLTKHRGRKQGHVATVKAVEVGGELVLVPMDPAASAANPGQRTARRERLDQALQVVREATEPLSGATIAKLAGLDKNIITSLMTEAETLDLVTSARGPKRSILWSVRVSDVCPSMSGPDAELSVRPTPHPLGGGTQDTQTPNLVDMLTWKRESA